MGKGQPSATIRTILVFLEYIMLHYKFPGQGSNGSVGENLLNLLPYLCIAAILVIFPGQFEQLIALSTPGGYKEFVYNWPSGFRGKVD